MGGNEDDSVFYYRIHSPVILVEFDHRGHRLDNDQPSRNHIHTVVRTPNGNDYGKDLLRQHLLRDHAPRSAGATLREAAAVRPLLGSGGALSTLALPAIAVRGQTALSAGMQASVTGDGVNLRGGPGTDQPIVGSLAAGSTIDLLGASASGAWWRAATDVGPGYVNADWLSEGPGLLPATRNRKPL